MLPPALLFLFCSCFTSVVQALQPSLPFGANSMHMRSNIVDPDTLQLTQHEVRYHHSRRRYHGALRAYIQSELLLRQVVQECAKGEDTVLQLSHLQADQLQVLQHLPDDAPCPALDIALRGSERGVGMCTDVALYIIHLGPVSHTGRGARLIPLLPGTAMKGYNARCTTTTARMLLESMYHEWFAPPAVGGYHIMQVNSEHLFKSHQELHSRIDVFLCKTRFCQTLLWKYVSHHGWKSEVWFIGHTSSDVLVTSSMLNPSFLQTSSAAILLSPAGVTTMSAAATAAAQPSTGSKRMREGISGGTGSLSATSTISTSNTSQHQAGNPQQLNEPSNSLHNTHTRSRTLGVRGQSSTAADFTSQRLNLSTHLASERNNHFSRFLHVKGKSGLKHTRQLLECWASHPEFPLLTVIGQISGAESGSLKAAVSNVRLLPKPSVGGRRMAAVQCEDFALAPSSASFGGSTGQSQVHDKLSYVQTLAVPVAEADKEGARGNMAAGLGAAVKAGGKLTRRHSTTAARDPAGTHNTPQLPGDVQKGQFTRTGSGLGMPCAMGSQSSRDLAGLDSQQMLSFEEIRQMQVSMGVHVCASEREGFGHYLNEARAAGAVVISTDHPPMNEMVQDGVDGVLIKPATTGSYTDLQALAPYGSINALLSPTDICNGVQRVLGLSLHERQQLGQRARARYLQEKSSFVRKVRVLRKVLHRRRMEQKFSVPRPR